MKTKLLAAALFALTTGLVIGYPIASQESPTPPAPLNKPVPSVAARPKVEAVFVLDTTGSMSGLIDAAKENIWSIASSMAQAQPTPELRIGLVAFRDRGDSYVTQVIDLSTDLDSMYAKLMAFQADGGGDTPESVNQALHEAVHDMSWSKDDRAYRTIFLVGDAPPHRDYDNDTPFEQTVKVAHASGIVINTLQAGQDGDTEKVWRQIASLNQGRYLQVGMEGDRVAVATPFDAEIAEISKAIDETRLFFGSEEMRRELDGKVAATDKLHAEGSVAARAKRATFNASVAGKDNALGENELVDAVSSGRVDLYAIDQDELPEPMKTLSAAEQVKLVAQAAVKREELNSRLGALAAQRRDFVEQELDRSGNKAASLDYQVFEAVKEQAEKKGLRYAEAPVN